MIKTAPLDIIEGVPVHADHSDPCQFWYLPTTPVLAHRDDKRAIFSLISYRKAPADSSGTVEGGGYLNFQVNLGIPDTTRRKIMSRIAAEKMDGDPRLTVAPFDGGSVSVIILNAQGGATPATPATGTPPVKPPETTTGHVLKIIGSTKPSMVGDNSAIFSAKLDADGAALLNGALKKGAAKSALIGILYELQYTAMLPAIQVRVQADMKQAYEHISSAIDAQYGFFATDVTAVVEDLKATQHIKIESIDPVGTPESQKAIDAFTEHFKKYITEKWFEAKLTPSRTPAVAKDLDKVSKRGDEILARAKTARQEEEALLVKKIALEKELLALETRKQSLAEVKADIQRLTGEIATLKTKVGEQAAAELKQKQAEEQAAKDLETALLAVERVAGEIKALKQQITDAKDDKAKAPLAKELKEKKEPELEAAEGKKDVAEKKLLELKRDGLELIKTQIGEQGAKATTDEKEGTRLKQDAKEAADPNVAKKSPLSPSVAPEGKLVDLLGTQGKQVASMAAGLPIVSVAFKYGLQKEQRSFDGEFSSQKAVSRTFYPNGFVGLASGDVADLEASGYFLQVSLDDEFWKMFELEVDGPSFGEYGLKTATVKVTYAGDDERAGRKPPQDWEETFRASPAAAADAARLAAASKKWRTPMLKNGRFEYQIQYAFDPKVWDFAGDDDVSPKLVSEFRHIHVEPEEQFTFYDISVDFFEPPEFTDTLREIQVSLQYPSARIVPAPTLRRQKTFVFKADAKAAQNWKLRLKGKAAPLLYSYQATYVFKDGTTKAVEAIEATSPRLLIKNPYQSKAKTVGIRPVGTWSEVDYAMIYLRYVDPPNLVNLDTSIELVITDGTAGQQSWALSIRDEQVKTFTWQGVFGMKDGTERQTQWMTAPLERPLMVRLPAAGSPAS